MADYTVIADVSNTLIRLFQQNLVPDLIPKPELIGLAPPVDSGDLALSLFLYEIQQNGINQAYNMINSSANTLQVPPMALDLHFLMTAHSGASPQQRTIDEHLIMGRAIQVLYDNSLIQGSILQGSLGDNNEEFQIVMLDQLSVHNLGLLFPNKTYKLSFNFIAGPIYLDSTRNQQTARTVTPQTNVTPS